MIEKITKETDVIINTIRPSIEELILLEMKLKHLLERNNPELTEIHLLKRQIKMTRSWIIQRIIYKP